MITTERLHTILYWLILLQCCVISVSIAAASLFLGLSLVVILILAVQIRRWPFHPTPLDVAFLAYLAIEFVTAFFSVEPMEALKNTKRLLLISIVYAVATTFATRQRVMTALRVIAVVVGVLSLVEIFFYYHNGGGRLHLFQHYMTTGGLKMIVGNLLIPFFLSADIAKNDRRLFFGSFITIIVALLLTNTRSAWLGFIVGVIVISVLQYRKLLFVLGGLILAFFLFAPEQQIDRAKSIVDLSHPNNVGRVKMWTTGLEMWKDKPIFGFGDIDLYSSYSRYRTPGIDEPAGHLHNIFIHLLVTIGAVGFVVVMFLFYKIVRMEYDVFSHNKHDVIARNVALGAMAVFAGFLMNGMFEWNFGDHEIMVFVWLTVGLSLAMDRNI